MEYLPSFNNCPARSRPPVKSFSPKSSVSDRVITEQTIEIDSEPQSKTPQGLTGSRGPNINQGPASFIQYLSQGLPKLVGPTGTFRIPTPAGFLKPRLTAQGLSLELTDPHTGKSREIFEAQVSQDEEGCIQGIKARFNSQVMGASDPPGTPSDKSAPTPDSEPETLVDISEDFDGYETTQMGAELRGQLQGQVTGRVRGQPDNFEALIDLNLTQNHDQTQTSVQWIGARSHTAEDGTSTPTVRGQTQGSLVNFDCRTLSSPGNLKTSMLDLINSANKVWSAVCQEADEASSSESSRYRGNQVTYELDQISGQYHDDIDLIRIDSLVRAKFQREKNELKSLQKKLQTLRKQPLDVPMVKKLIKELKNRINDLKTDRMLKLYQDQTEDLVQEYQELTTGTHAEPRFREMDILLEVIDEYLHLAGKYIRIDVIRLEDTIQICPECQIDLSEVETDGESVIQCPNCKTNQQHLEDEPQPDRGQLNPHWIENSSDWDSFNEAKRCYCGEETIKKSLDPALQQLDNYLQSMSGKKGKRGKPASWYRSQPLIGTVPGRRRKAGTARETLLEAISRIDSDLYRHAALISKLLWGWEIPNLDHLWSRIERDYQISQVVYNRIKGDRKSSISSNYRLFRLLWHIGHPCHPRDFKLVTTTLTMANYEKIGQDIYLEVGPKLGWRPWVSIEVLYKMDYDTLEMPQNFGLLC